MDTKIKDTFWKDPAVEQLVEAGDRDAILSLLWLMTAEVNHAGWVEVTPRRFLFQTSCNFEALQRACQALGKGIVTHPKGFWIRNFIRHQIGSGEALAANNMAAPVIKSFQTTPPEIVTEVLTQYPELQARIASQKINGKRSPSQALAEGCHSTREEKNREEKSRAEGIGSAEGKATTGPITLTQAKTYAQTWTNSAPVMIAFDANEVELWFLDRQRKSWQASSGNIINTRAAAEADLKFWLTKNNNNPAPLPRRDGRGNPDFQKKGGAGGGGNPLAAPPCADWKGIARDLAPHDSDLTWLQAANWTDLSSDDRQAIVSEWKRRNAGGAAA
jgi:hypothetical protein